MEEDHAREWKNRLEMQKSIVPDELHPQMLRQRHVGSLLIISERPWWLGEVPEDCKKANVPSVFKGEKEDQCETDQPCIYFWEDDGTSNPRNHYQTYEGQESD